MPTMRNIRLILWVGAVSIAWLAAIAEEPRRASREAAGDPFEGHLWTDVSGRPLPFQSDAEIEAFLREAEVSESTHIGTGITMPRQIVLTRGDVSAHAIFKDVEVERHKVTERTAGRSRFYLDWRDSHVYDRAAYKVDRLLGINRVPPAVARRVGGKSGTMVMWVERTMNEAERRRKNLAPPDGLYWRRQQQIMHIFNNLIAKRDINPGNTLIDADWRIWFIDSTRAFGNFDDLLYPEAITWCERRLWDRLRALQPKEVRDRLGSCLSRSEIRALLNRRDKLVDHLSGLIDERGEGAVIFDMMTGAEAKGSESGTPEAEGHDANST